MNSTSTTPELDRLCAMTDAEVEGAIPLSADAAGELLAAVVREVRAERLLAVNLSGVASAYDLRGARWGVRGSRLEVSFRAPNGHTYETSADLPADWQTAELLARRVFEQAAEDIAEHAA